MLRLRTPTTPTWIDAVRADVDAFLQDHAANERKISASALTLAVQHPDRRPLVDAMVALARGELEHFALFLRLAQRYAPPATVGARLAALLDAEAALLASLPVRAALH